MGWSDYLTLKLLNVLLVLWFTALNVYIFSLTIGARHPNEMDPEPATRWGYGLGRETLMTPAPWIFAALFLVHLLLLGLAGFVQWTTRGKEIVIERLTWRFPTMLILSMLWTVAWVRQEYIIALIIAAFVALITSHVYLLVKREFLLDDGFDWQDQLFIHAPLSIYHGWTMFILAVSVFPAFGARSESLSPPAQFFAVWLEAMLTATAIAYAASRSTTSITGVKPGPGDPLAALTITLGLFAIFAHQLNVHPNIGLPEKPKPQRAVVATWISLVLAIISTWATAWGTWTAVRAYRTGGVHLEGAEGDRNEVPGANDV